MRNIGRIVILSVFSVLALVPKPVFAGPYGYDMAKCLVRSTTDADKGALVQWMFAAISLNPEVKSMVTMTMMQRDAYNKRVANLIMRLLTVTCKKETQIAIKKEGQVAIPNSFRILGAVAARRLITHPAVSAYIAGTEKYMDKKKLQELKNGEK